MTDPSGPERNRDTDIGGMEQDVLHSFASLSPHARGRLFDEYERRFGHPARAYAERAAGFWLSSRARISPELTARLFELTPAFLTPPARIQLVERLWRRKRGGGDALLRIPPDATAEDIIAAVRAHFAEQLQPWALSTALRERFPWLDERDIEAQQQILNMLLAAERDRLLEAADGQITMLFGRAGGQLQRVRQELEIAGQRLELVSDPDCRTLRVEPRRSTLRRTATADSAVVWIVVCFAGGAGLGLLLWWLASQVP